MCTGTAAHVAAVGIFRFFGGKKRRHGTQESEARRLVNHLGQK